MYNNSCCYALLSLPCHRNFHCKCHKILFILWMTILLKPFIVYGIIYSIRLYMYIARIVYMVLFAVVAVCLSGSTDGSVWHITRPHRVLWPPDNRAHALLGSRSQILPCQAALANCDSATASSYLSSFYVCTLTHSKHQSFYCFTLLCHISRDLTAANSAVLIAALS